MIFRYIQNLCDSNQKLSKINFAQKEGVYVCKKLYLGE
jgi:hypothetical protein